jgi:hypothetical protein
MLLQMRRSTEQRDRLPLSLGTMQTGQRVHPGVLGRMLRRQKSVRNDS